MATKKTIDEKLLDVRAVERNIQSGAIKKSEVDQCLKSLPDMEEEAEPFEVNQKEVLEDCEEKRQQYEQAVAARGNQKENEE